MKNGRVPISFNLRTGQLGEKIARKYLEKKGYKIIDQNYRTKFAEIDLIIKKENEIIFIEVRTKRGDSFGLPEESFNQRKLRKLWLSAKFYALRIGWRGPFRIDAICILLHQIKDTVKEINHYKNII